LGNKDQHRVAPSTRRKKVLFITRAYDFGGAEKHLLDLVSRLDETALQLSIVCLGKDFYSARLNASQKIVVTTCNHEPKSVWEWARLIRETRPDVVVFIYGWLWAIPWRASIGAWLAAVPKRFSIQHLIAPADMNRGWIRGAVRRMFGTVNLKLSASLFQSTIAVSNNLRNSLIHDFGFPAKKVITIHNGVSLTEFVPVDGDGSELKSRFGFSPDEFVLVCTARLSEQKGIDILLQGIALTLRRGIHCKCLLVGDGPLKENLMAQARDLGLSQHVFFEGFCENIQNYLHTGSAFILSSYREGLPLSILEAMASGLPCVVTDVGGNSEAVVDGVNGLLIPPGSPEAVADAIQYLSEHEDKRAQMAIRARALAREEFDIEKCMAGISRVILN
jgi:glycosyltransferase involved in cell wall biosynthesis